MKASVSAEGIIHGEWSLDQELMRIGRQEDCEIYLDNPAVSRLHAEIQCPRPGVLTFKATSTTNETSLNGLELTPNETVELDHGDLIVLSGIVHIRIAEGVVTPDEEWAFKVSGEEVDSGPTTPMHTTQDSDEDLGATRALGGREQNLMHELDVVRAELVAALREDHGIQETTRKVEIALARAREQLRRARATTRSLQKELRSAQGELRDTQKKLLARGTQNQRLRKELRRTKSNPPPEKRGAPQSESDPPADTRRVRQPKKAPPGTPPPTKQTHRPAPPTTRKMPRAKPANPLRRQKRRPPPQDAGSP